MVGQPKVASMKFSFSDYNLNVKGHYIEVWNNNSLGWNFAGLNLNGLFAIQSGTTPGSFYSTARKYMAGYGERTRCMSTQSILRRDVIFMFVDIIVILMIAIVVFRQFGFGILCLYLFAPFYLYVSWCIF